MKNLRGRNENCPSDCCPPSGCVEDKNKGLESGVTKKEGEKIIVEDDKSQNSAGEKEKITEKGKKSLFESIINFLRGLFGK